MPAGQNLYFKIYGVVRRIPKGKVASYGQIATLAGNPRASRVVGWALRTLKSTTNVPWHRVINKAGMISIENMNVPKDYQAMKLREEGVEVAEREGNFFVEMERFGWKP